MSLETGRTNIEQGVHEFTVIKGLENAHSSTKGWGEKETQLTEAYLTRFIDAMLRIQTGDVQTIAMLYKVNPSGHEVVQLRLPIMRNFEMTITKKVKELESIEPNVRDLLPVSPSSQ